MFELALVRDLFTMRRQDIHATPQNACVRFGKMVAALRKRFAGTRKSSANGKTHNGKAH